MFYAPHLNLSRTLIPTPMRIAESADYPVVHTRFREVIPSAFLSVWERVVETVSVVCDSATSKNLVKQEEQRFAAFLLFVDNNSTKSVEIIGRIVRLFRYRIRIMRRRVTICR